MDIKEQIPLAPRTTFSIGGSAAYLVEAASVADIQEAYSFARGKGIGVQVLGGGSNVLVPDDGVNALVLQIKIKGMRRVDTAITCGAGEVLFDLVKYAAAQGLAGLEGLAGVPGTVGGAVRGNAEAFGTATAATLVSVHALDTKSGKEETFKNSECGFAYRTSNFKTQPSLIILEAEFALAPADPMVLEAKIIHTLSERNRRHIQDIQSAGSFFKNPVAPRAIQEMFEKEKGVASKEGRVPAGWLMDRAGLKGVRVGDAVSSEYHTNYFLNSGHATAREVLLLAALAKEKVFKDFGVQLEEEVSIL